MKNIFIFIIISSILFAQNKVDSILTSIKNKSTIEKIKILDEFCWKNRDVEPELSIQAANNALKLAESINNKHFISKSLNYLSFIYRDQGQYKKSLILANRGLDVALSANDKTEIAYSYNNISTIYRLMGNYPEAIKKLYDALKIFEGINDSTGIGYCYYNLGLVQIKQKSFDKALFSFSKTIEIRDRIKDKEGKTKALGRLAEVYLRIGETEKALNIFKEVENSFSKLPDLRALIGIKMGIADIFKQKNDIQNAIHKREEALSIARKIYDVIGMVTNLSELGNLYAITKNYSKAKILLDEAKNITDKNNSAELKIVIYKNFAKFYEAQKDYQNAYKYLKMLKAQQDSLNEMERKSAINEVEFAYQISKKEKENEILKANYEKERTRIKYLILIFLLLVVLIITLYSLYQTNKKKSAQLRSINTTKDKFFSIIAHDLRGPISSQFGITSILIDEFHEISDEEKLRLIKSVDQASKQTYKLLENLLYWARSQTGKLEFNPKRFNLYEVVEDVVSLLKEGALAKQIKIDLENKPQFFVNADEEMIKTVLRNLISNAIKFTNAGGLIKIFLKENNDCKIISVEDSGVGIDKNYIDKLFSPEMITTTKGTEGEKGTGLGLILCKEFLEKNNGKIWVESELGKGTTFSFSLPS